MFDAFLKIDGIKGESTDSKHKDEIEVESFSWGLAQTGTFAAGGGAGAGKVQFQDFHFVTGVSKASPNLFLKCATGQHITVAELSVRKSGESPQDFMHIKMEDVLISSYQNGGSSQGETIPTDQVSLNFAKIEFAFTTLDPKGGVGETVKAGWDLKKNTRG